jgi:carboxymethylenebutenolidase
MKRLIFSLTLVIIFQFQNSIHADMYMGEFVDHANDIPITSEGAIRNPLSKVTSSEVIYGQSQGQSHKGFFSEPDDKATSGLIVIHEWWGLNEDIHLMNEQLAGLGYSSLALDLYEGKSASKVKDAFQLSTNLSNNEQRALDNIKQAYDYLKNEVGVDKVGIIGWCLGGKWSLRGALMLPNKIDATVIYYGSLVNDKEKLATLEMPIIGFVGTKDRLYKQFIEFSENLEDLNKDSSIHIYEGARHAFANSSGIAYESEAANDSWQKTVAFLEKQLN